MERTGVAAMALGIVEECLKLCVDYARTRVAFGKPIGEFQLIQDKLARMEVARLNVQNLVFRFIEMASAGKSLTLDQSGRKSRSSPFTSSGASSCIQWPGPSMRS